MKGITRCADCAYYSMKKHRCIRGARDDSEPRASFFADCPLDDVVPVVHGWWIELPSMEPDFKCSECGQSYACWEPSEAHYCPNCGAKMDLEVE